MFWMFGTTLCEPLDVAWTRSVIMSVQLSFFLCSAINSAARVLDLTDQKRAVLFDITHVWTICDCLETWLYVWTLVCLNVCMDACVIASKCDCIFGRFCVWMYVWTLCYCLEMLIVCMDACVFECMYGRLCVWMYVWTLVCLNVCMDACVFECMYGRFCVWMYLCNLCDGLEMLIQHLVCKISVTFVCMPRHVRIVMVHVCIML